MVLRSLFSLLLLSVLPAGYANPDMQGFIEHFSRLERKRLEAVSVDKPVRTITVSDLRIADVVWCGDLLISTSGADRAAAVWNPAKGERLSKLESLFGSRAITCTVQGELFAIGSPHKDKSSSISIWEPRTGRHISDILKPPVLLQEKSRSTVVSLAFSRNKRYLLAYFANQLYNQDYQVALYKTPMWELAHSFPIHRPVTNVALSTNGDRIAYAHLSKFIATVYVHNTKTGDVEQNLKIEMIRPHAIIFSPSNKTAFVVGESLSNCIKSEHGFKCHGENNEVIREYDLFTGSLLREITTGHIYAVNSIVLDGRGKYLATASEDKTVEVYDAVSGKLLYTFSDRRNKVYSTNFRLDGRYIASAGNVINVWQVEYTAPARGP